MQTPLETALVSALRTDLGLRVAADAVYALNTDDRVFKASVDRSEAFFAYTPDGADGVDTVTELSYEDYCYAEGNDPDYG